MTFFLKEFIVFNSVELLGYACRDSHFFDSCS